MYLHSVKTELRAPQDTEESKELCCPTQTKCLAERIRFIVENRQAICSLKQWSPHSKKSLF